MIQVLAKLEFMMIKTALSKRILILDGATGTMVQRGFSIEEIHGSYIEAGADIIKTNTFNLKGYDDTFNYASIARRLVDEANEYRSEDDRVYVAGVLGPYSSMLSLSDKADVPQYRSCSFDELSRIYRENASALFDAGADLILLETFFDPLNTKSALYALETLFNERGIRLPVMVSATINDRSGRLLTGISMEAFYVAVSSYDLLSFGINCSFGAEEMAPVIREISGFSSFAVSMHPNAGLPNELGGYEETPEQMAEVIRKLALEGCLNIAGGCCGTTPDHIRAIKNALCGVHPRPLPGVNVNSGKLTVSGLEKVTVDLLSTNFVNVGERTNVAGSRKFARLIGEGKYDEAADIALKQIDDGAAIIDINTDDPLLDSAAQMETFVRYIVNDPSIAKSALMIDSSDWNTVLAGIKNAPGRCIVNSISLKEGEVEFLRKAREIHSLGAAVIVMAFDETGQATTYERKIEICTRAYKLLTKKAGYRPEEIVFDVNILTVGTGMPEHDNYAVEFIRAVSWIKKNLPGCHTSGGVSNLSFSFRGNNKVREAMHSVFLYHAIEAGLDMAIVNPGTLRIYGSIDPELRNAAEDVVLNRDHGATDRLMALAQKIKLAETDCADTAASGEKELVWRNLPVEERLQYALVHGVGSFLKEDLDAVSSEKDSVSIVEGPLLKGMETVGELFSRGEMFLPQVIKSARTMRSAVEILQPGMTSSKVGKSRAKMILATAKGDVHDIGKNILSVVLSCGAIEVIDLGVMVDNSTIIETIKSERPDFVGISGLITPSLTYMKELCVTMEKEGFKIPLFVGGAAASALHTAMVLSPEYGGGVIYTSGASECANVINRMLSDPEKEMASILYRYESLRQLKRSNEESFVSLEEARARSVKYPLSSFVQPEGFGEKDLKVRYMDISQLVSFVDWRMFLAFWGFKGKSLENLLNENPEAEKCYEDGMSTLSRMILLKDVEVSVKLKFFDACSQDDKIVFPEVNAEFDMGRSTSSMTRYESLADFVPPFSSGLTSRVGLFVVKVKDNSPHCCKQGCREYSHLLRESVCARLAEAASQWLQSEIHLDNDCTVIRPAFGYPSCPDHSLKCEAFALLDAENEFGMGLTSSFAMIPVTSVCGMVICHQDAQYPNIRTE